MKRPQLVDGEIYHIVIRGTGDSLIFKDESDYYRGIFSIYEFNTTDFVTIRERRKVRIQAKVNREQTADTRNFLVEILSFCFMPNHIHLLLKQLKEDGVTNFMKKISGGYATYFNKKYNRKGHLFQGRFHAIHIENDEQLKTVFVYIHTNPVSLIEPNWKENGIENPEKIIKFLENYKWSSYPDYIEKKNFSSVTKRDSILRIMGEKEGCREFVEDWIRYKREFKNWDKISLE